MTGIDRAKYMDDDEVRRLCTVTEAHAIRDLAAGRVRGVLAWAVIDTALQTGLRVSELVRLKIGDVQSKRGNGGALRVWRHKCRRCVQETLAISRELAKHLQEFIAWKEDVGQSVAPDAPLFVGKRGPLSVPGLRQVWKRAVAEAGLPPGLSIHSARHTMALHLLRKTRSLRQVRKQLGHTSAVVPPNMYADVSFEDMQAGLNGLYAEHSR